MGNIAYRFANVSNLICTVTLQILDLDHTEIMRDLVKSKSVKLLILALKQKMYHCHNYNIRY